MAINYRLLSKIFSVFLVTGVLLSVICSPVFSQKPVPLSAFEIVPDETIPSTTSIDGRINAATGVPIVMYQVNVETIGADPVERALNFINDRLILFGISERDFSSLEQNNLRQGDGGTIIRFQQRHQGFKVYKGGMVIGMNKADRITWVINDMHQGLGVFPLAPAISQTDARVMAQQAIGVSGGLNYQFQELLVYPFGSQPRLAWQYRVEPQDPLGYWEVLIDAMTGEFIKIQNLSAYCRGNYENQDYGISFHQHALPYAPMRLAATGDGDVFDPDPLSSAQVAYAGQYVDGNDATNASLQAQIFNRVLQDIEFTGTEYRLRGPYAYLIDFEAPNRGIFGQAGSSFIFDRQANGFEAVNGYYHIDQSMRWINVGLGIACMPFQYANGVQFDPHGLNGADNSHYLGGSGRISFGEGGVDDAEDADVLLHELGHGIHDWLTGGNLSQVDGLSEGSGDYWAQSYSRSLGQWTAGDAAYQWVFNWDGHNPFWNGRITNYGASYPGGLVGQIHTDGQIWSTCMMQIWDQIGRVKTDRVFLEGLALTNGSSSQNDAANAVQQAGLNLGYNLADMTVINTVLQSCGYTLPALPPLPVIYFSFEGKRTAKEKVLLTWETLTEVNNQAFEIERRSASETSFAKIGFLNADSGMEDKTQRGISYNFEDPEAGRSRVFYRLKQIDFNGEAHFSETIEIEPITFNERELIVYPNPAKDRIIVAWDPEGIDPEKTKIGLTDLVGKEIKLGKNPVFLGHGEWEILLPPTLPAGMYLVRINSGAYSRTLRFRKF